MHVSVTSLIYCCIFLTIVNNQEKSVSVMVGKMFSLITGIFTCVSRKSMLSRYFR